MKKTISDIIWLSPSLAAGAIVARLVAFFETRLRLTSPYHAPTVARWRSFGWTVEEGR
jgi:hypothetical protein